MASAQNIPLGAIRTYLIAGVAALGLLLLGIGGWAATTELAGAVVAPGVVVVNSNVKKIQHPMGGIVKELLVRNGDFVKAGQAIVRLDDTQARSNWRSTSSGTTSSWRVRRAWRRSSPARSKLSFPSY